ncbi:MAG: YggS family pyridoxal phosphate-dependent enzyme [Proteobacteria bacterium]|nr:YggS family pyridoxal phosphate-dependent enzyme [Pseudomonadota bacterium]
MLTAPQFSPAALQMVRARIARAAESAGRDPDSVRLLAVSKQQPAALVRAAVAAGQTEFGENYAQEGIDKVAALADVPGLAWHFIGQLQGNKTREVAECFDWVHTVDRERIASRLSAQRPRDAAPLQVLLQVRLADEPGKGGVAPAEAPALAAAVTAMPRIRLRGLMCIPPPAADLEAQRRPFRRLRELMESLNAAGHALDTLSMGMSDDLEAAVLEGATIVRVGTAIFGRRPG